MSIHFCGRLTRKGSPCTNSVAANPNPISQYVAPACNWHLTVDERAAHTAVKAEWDAVMARHAASKPKVPACWSWAVTEEDRKRAVATQWLGDWGDGCAVCGVHDARVLDHDHRTGWARGYLCRGCNILEANSDSTLFRRYRKHNPATILGVWDRYSSFYGPDRGQVNGRQTYLPWMVDGQGVIHYDPPSIANDPAHLVAAALLT